MATTTARNPNQERRAPRDEDDDEASVGELVGRALGGARELAIHEATLALAELEHDADAVRKTLVLAFVGATCLGVAVAWAGVALAHALSLGAVGLTVLAVLAAIVAGAALAIARERAPVAFLEKFRARLERRIARVTEKLR